MENSNRTSRRNPPLSIEDFKWGQAEGPVQIGIWSAHASIDMGNKVEVRVAVLNLSSHVVEMGNDFGLALHHGEEIREYFGGPRSSTPILLQPEEFQEILGWRLSEESGLEVGINKCWAVYRSDDGREIQSESIDIEVRSRIL